MELDFSKVGTSQDPGTGDMPATSNSGFRPEAELLPAVKVYSLEAVKPKFAEARERINKIIEESGIIAVNDDDSLKYAVALIGEARKMVKIINLIRDEAIGEQEEYVKSVKAFAKQIVDSLGTASTALDGKATQYRDFVELERRKQEQAAREAARKAQEELDRQAEEANRKAREEAARRAEDETRARLAKDAEERAKKAKEDEAARIEREKREADEIEKARKAAEEEAAKNAIKAPEVMVPNMPEEKKTIRTETGTTAYVAKKWKGEITDPSAVPREYCIPSMPLVNDAIKKGVRDIPGVRIWEDKTTKYRT